MLLKVCIKVALISTKTSFGTKLIAMDQGYKHRRGQRIRNNLHLLFHTLHTTGL